jgi:hypothetical protein
MSNMPREDFLNRQPCFSLRGSNVQGIHSCVHFSILESHVEKTHLRLFRNVTSQLFPAPARPLLQKFTSQLFPARPFLYSRTSRASLSLCWHSNGGTTHRHRYMVTDGAPKTRKHQQDLWYTSLPRPSQHSKLVVGGASKERISWRDQARVPVRQQPLHC